MDNLLMSPRLRAKSILAKRNARRTFINQVYPYAILVVSVASLIVIIHNT